MVDEIRELLRLMYNGAGWYWWACFPGCLPDSDPFGPFESERAAIDDCKGF